MVVFMDFVDFSNKYLHLIETNPLAKGGMFANKSVPSHVAKANSVPNEIEKLRSELLQQEKEIANNIVESFDAKPLVALNEVELQTVRRACQAIHERKIFQEPEEVKKIEAMIDQLDQVPPPLAPTAVSKQGIPSFFPDEILYQILSYVEPHKISQVSKKWHAISKDISFNQFVHRAEKQFAPEQLKQIYLQLEAVYEERSKKNSTLSRNEVKAELILKHLFESLAYVTNNTELFTVFIQNYLNRANFFALDSIPEIQKFIKNYNLLKLVNLVFADNKQIQVLSKKIYRLIKKGKSIDQEIEKLKKIAQNVTIKILNLQSNHFTELPPVIASWNCESIMLNNNHIEQIPPEIGQCSTLKGLWIERNHLVSLPPEIGQLSSLQKLQLEKNQLTKLPNTIGNLTNLKELNISNNNIEALPLEIGSLVKLEIFTIAHNRITQLPKTLANLINLQTLEAPHNQIKSLPIEIGKLIALQRINLEHNQLVELPDEINQLSNLKTLNVNSNDLVSFPLKLSGLTQLEDLSASANHLKEISQEIGYLTHLHSLNLRGNDLSQLPATIANLPRLQRLDIAKNPMVAVQSEIANIQSLKYLTISKENPISSENQERLRQRNCTIKRVA